MAVVKNRRGGGAIASVYIDRGTNTSSRNAFYQTFVIVGTTNAVAVCHWGALKIRGWEGDATQGGQTTTSSHASRAGAVAFAEKKITEKKNKDYRNWKDENRDFWSRSDFEDWVKSRMPKELHDELCALVDGSIPGDPVPAADPTPAAAAANKSKFNETDPEWGTW